jgi:tetratricopeptide (TPR) repeat protein
MTAFPSQHVLYRIAIEELNAWMNLFGETPTKEFLLRYSIVRLLPRKVSFTLERESMAQSVPSERLTWQELCLLRDPETDYESLVTLLRHVRGILKTVQAHCFYARSLWPLFRYEEAVEELQAALNVVPDHPFALPVLGETYYFQKDYEGAERVLSQSIMVNPTYGRAYMTRALAYDALAWHANNDVLRADLYRKEVDDLLQARQLLPSKKIHIDPALLHAQLLLKEFTA